MVPESVDFFSEIRYNTRMLNEKGIEMNLDQINAELQEAADQERLEQIEREYDEWEAEQQAYHHMMMYACHSYDNDAIFYGENS